MKLYIFGHEVSLNKNHVVLKRNLHIETLNVIPPNIVLLNIINYNINT